MVLNFCRYLILESMNVCVLVYAFMKTTKSYAYNNMMVISMNSIYLVQQFLMKFTQKYVNENVLIRLNHE